MADQKAAFHGLSGDNHGPIITLVSVSLLIVAVIFVLAKFGSALYFKQRRTAVNTPIWIALIIAIIQVVVLQKGVDNGLGKHQDRLNESDVRAWSKLAYTAHILLILVMSLTKLSTILLIWKLTPSGSLRRYCTIATGIVVAWTIFAILGLALQCELPEPWLYHPGRCAGQGAIFYPIATFNVITEIILVILPFIMMHNVQMVWHKRVKILSSFSSRISIVALAIAQLALIPSFIHSTDISWTMIPYATLSQTMMLTSITIACVPTLYHIFSGLHSGLTTTEIPAGLGPAFGLELSLSRRKKTTGSGYLNHTSSGGSKYLSSGSRGRGRGRSREGRGMGRESPLFNPPGTDAAIVTEITSDRTERSQGFGEIAHGHGHGRGRGSSGSDSEAESQRHLTKETGGVMRTVDINVTIEVEGSHRDRHGVEERRGYL
ncbi:uncharacterized protein BDV14DRAFT_178372 [Aspergillus stella-maris]|uniref:uncharacterized protein n=1 Tax=Aspergillus stella-maris TaxID=1810926 RepID=UPI003CCD9A11